MSKFESERNVYGKPELCFNEAVRIGMGAMREHGLMHDDEFNESVASAEYFANRSKQLLKSKTVSSKNKSRFQLQHAILDMDLYWSGFKVFKQKKAKPKIHAGFKRIGNTLASVLKTWIKRLDLENKTGRTKEEQWNALFEGDEVRTRLSFFYASYIREMDKDGVPVFN